MGFLDEIKNKMHLGGQQGYDQSYDQDDDYGYDDGYDDGYQNNGYSGASGEGFYTQDEPSNGLLGQTRRGEAESVAVYTRSGQLVGDDSRHATTYNPPSRSQDSVAGGYRPGAYDTPSSYAESARARAAAPAPAPAPAAAPPPSPSNARRLNKNFFINSSNAVFPVSQLSLYAIILSFDEEKTDRPIFTHKKRRANARLLLISEDIL